MAAPTGAAAQAMRDLWAQTVAEVKKEATQPALFRALEQTVAVAYEDGQFAVGFGGNDAQIGSLIKTPQYQMQIERALRRVAGDPELRLRVIEGPSYSDWEHTKKRDSATQARQQQTVQRQVTEAAAFGSWDELYDQVSRLWANSEGRSLTIGKGRYLENALNLVEEGVERLYPKTGKTDDLADRGLSRVIERVASMTNTDAAVVAYLLIQRQKSKG